MLPNSLTLYVPSVNATGTSSPNAAKSVAKELTPIYGGCIVTQGMAFWQVQGKAATRKVFFVKVFHGASLGTKPALKILKETCQLLNFSHMSWERNGVLVTESIPSLEASSD